MRMAFIQGDDTAESLTGTEFDDALFGMGGDDTLSGLAGADTMNGGTGNDRLHGGTGNDDLDGGDGTDTLIGAAGDDWLTGSGADAMFGGAGNDTISGNGRTYGGTGDDIAIIDTSSDSTLDGGADTDLLQLTWLAPDLDVFIQFEGPGAGAQIAGLVQATFTNFERLFALTGAGNDTVLGGSMGDVISVGLGNNLVDAGDGADEVHYVADGQNTLEGGSGVDTLHVWANLSNALYFIINGAGGVDDGQLSAISGFERYVANGSLLDDTLALWDGDDRAYGHDGNDFVDGRAGADELFGGKGNDLLYGDLDDDTLFGGRDSDTLSGMYGNDVLSGDQGTDILTGDMGTDKLAGGAGDDYLFGGADRDTLVGGPGTDTMTGGDGSDVFHFARSESGFDLIMDFASGEDRINYMLQPFDNYGITRGSLAPERFAVGTAVGSQAQFVLIFHAAQGETWLHFDDNGDDPAGGTYALFRFDGNVSVAASDIFLY